MNALDMLILQALPAAGTGFAGFFDGIKGKMQGAVNAIIIIAGIICLLMGAIFTVKKLVSKQGNDTSWIKIIAMYIVGVVLLAGLGAVSGLGTKITGLVNEDSGLGLQTSTLSTVFFTEMPDYPW